MSERGFIAVDRGIFDHPLFEERREFSRREAWLWLISEAEWKDREKYIGKAKVNLRRGQMAHSLRFIAEAWGWHKSKVERFLDRLKTETMIETDVETGNTVVTICNYDAYQFPENGNRDTKRATKRDSRETPARQTKTNKQTNNTSSNEEEEVCASDPVAVVIEAYGEMASKAGLSQVVAVSDKRKASIKARIDEHGMPAVLSAVERVGRSDFCCGRGPQGWKADLDFIVQPSSLIKILEGKYDNRAQAPPRAPDLADFFNDMARRGHDDGRTIEGSYERGDFDGSRQAIPRLAAEKGQR
jgi:hypothetical protein